MWLLLFSSLLSSSAACGVCEERATSERARARRLTGGVQTSEAGCGPSQTCAVSRCSFARSSSFLPSCSPKPHPDPDSSHCDAMSTGAAAASGAVTAAANTLEAMLARKQQVRTQLLEHTPQRRMNRSQRSCSALHSHTPISSLLSPARRRSPFGGAFCCGG